MNNTQDPTQSKNNQNLRTDLEQRRVLISASLVSILVLVSITNQNLMSKFQPEHQQSRAIASTSQSVHVDRAQYTWERDLAKQIAHQKFDSRELASVGRKPSAFEALRFGTLEGKYAFQLQNGKISTIDFVDSDTSNDRPKYITNKIDFLNKNRDLFVVDFDRVDKAEEIASGSLVAEVYKLYDHHQKLVGQVRFVSDLEGRARSIRAEPMN